MAPPCPQFRAHPRWPPASRGGPRAPPSRSPFAAGRGLPPRTYTGSSVAPVMGYPVAPHTRLPVDLCPGLIRGLQPYYGLPRASPAGVNRGLPSRAHRWTPVPGYTLLPSRAPAFPQVTGSPVPPLPGLTPAHGPISAVPPAPVSPSPFSRAPPPTPRPGFTRSLPAPESPVLTRPWLPRALTRPCAPAGQARGPPGHGRQPSWLSWLLAAGWRRPDHSAG